MRLVEAENGPNGSATRRLLRPVRLTMRRSSWARRLRDEAPLSRPSRGGAQGAPRRGGGGSGGAARTETKWSGGFEEDGDEVADERRGSAPKDSGG